LAGRGAVDALIADLQLTLSCIVRVVVVASGATPGRVHGVTLYAEGRPSGDPVRLRTHGGDGELLFQIVQLFEVILDPAQSPESYGARTTFYHCDILDRYHSEIVVYHWEPEGISPVRTPHLHVPAAAPILLPQRPSSALATRKTYLNRLHLATGFVTLADVVGVLIREFAVDPIRADWEEVLATRMALDRRQFHVV
jgi:hypothetical protein